jgi:hypothetical protein
MKLFSPKPTKTIVPSFLKDQIDELTISPQPSPSSSLNNSLDQLEPVERPINPAPKFSI